MTGWVITRNAADGTKRYDACLVGRGYQEEVEDVHEEEGPRTTTRPAMVKRVQDGTYVEVVPALYGRGCSTGGAITRSRFV